jgi:hypothetical protein
MRREGRKRENFFIAKYRDSESAQGAFSCRRGVESTSIATLCAKVLVMETPAAWALLAILTIAGVGFSRTIRIVARTHCGVVARRARGARASPRQHFLKRDAVFLGVLVYSGGSAFRFPSARSD